MTAARFLVVRYLGGWRIRHDGWQSRRYRCQADAIKVAFELARGVTHARVFLQEEKEGDVVVRELSVSKSNLAEAV